VAEILREKPKKTPRQNKRISEATRRKNKAWREWFVESDNNENLDKWRRLRKAARNMVNWTQKETWKEFLGIFEVNFKTDKKILSKIMEKGRKENLFTQKFIEKNGECKSESDTMEACLKYSKICYKGKEWIKL
jgi:hypothetical protein